MNQQIEQLKFLDERDVTEIAKQWGTPVYVYDEATLRQQAKTALAFPAPFGLTVRYAMKANPATRILQIFNEMGVAIDASSGYEAERAMAAGIAADKILLTSQQLPHNLKELAEQGVQFTACSLHQLREYGTLFPGGTVSVRINPGLGSGHSNRTNVGGPSSSFGIWYETIEEVLAISKEYNLTINRLHTHVGSGADPKVWTEVARISLDQVKHFPDVTTLDLGGGFKVARMQDEASTDLSEIGPVVSKALENFAQETGRKLKLEIEPGTFLVANAGAIVATIHDIVGTGTEGHTFLKVDTGMTELMRPSLYGSQHPLIVINDSPNEYEDYVVVGHCCESGDILTPALSDPEGILPRRLKKARIGDLMVIEATGAYGAAMSARNYNSFPAAAAILRTINGSYEEIIRAEEPHELTSREIISS